MPLSRMKFTPGVNTQMTATQNRSGWTLSNLIRWREGGLLEKIAGWLRLIQEQTIGIVRALHAYEDLSATNLLLIGTDGGAQIYDGANLSTFLFNRRYSTARANSVTFTNGSSLAVVHDVGHGVSIGNSVLFPITMTGGGRFYVGGSQFVVASIVDADNYRITLPAASTASGVASLPYYTNRPYSGTTGSFNVPIFLPAHGQLAGTQFVVQQSFTFNYPYTGSNEPSLNAPSGSYLITNVIDANNFTIQLTILVPVVPYDFIWSETGSQGLPTADVGPPISYIVSNAPVSPLNWFLDNFGQIALITFTDGPLYQFTPPVTGDTPIAVIVPNAPTACVGMFVGMPQAQVIELGAEAAGVQDPLLVRWSNTSDQNDWIATATNQAGSNRLSQGSRIVGGIQAPQTALIWTDIGLWTMQYTGPPFVYNFSEVGTGCGLIAPKARAILSSTVFWMGSYQFYFFDSSGIHDLPCDVWDYVFGDLDQENAFKVHAGSNSNFNEVWFFFPSITDGTGECSRYVKMTILSGGRVWDVGRMGRSAWMDSSVFGNAVGADLNLRLQQHDIGYDDDDAAMAGVFAQSGYSDMSDGGDIMQANEIIPDLKWFGAEPGAISVTLTSAMYPQGVTHSKGPYGMDMANMHIKPRIRGRQLSLLLEWVERKGYSARIGDWRIRAGASGKRP